MTDPVVPTPAPGWYPDPYGSGALRWWDGARWGSQVAPAAPVASPYAQPYGPPSGPPPRRPLPAGTPVHTVWIWLVVVLPLLPGLLLFLLHPQPLFRQSATGTHLVVGDPFALLGGPLFLVVVLVGWLLEAGVIVSAWLDYRELARRGVERPFHWAWAFLTLVYPIGRTVIVRRVSGRGWAPLWAAIGVEVAVFILAVVWSVTFTAQIIGTATQNVPLGA